MLAALILGQPDGPDGPTNARPGRAGGTGRRIVATAAGLVGDGTGRAADSPSDVSVRRSACRGGHAPSSASGTCRAQGRESDGSRADPEWPGPKGRRPSMQKSLPTGFPRRREQRVTRAFKDVLSTHQPDSPSPGAHRKSLPNSEDEGDFSISCSLTEGTGRYAKGSGELASVSRHISGNSPEG